MKIQTHHKQRRVQRFQRRYVLFFEISFRYIEMDRLLDACRGVIRGIQDLRVEIEDVVGELT